MDEMYSCRDWDDILYSTSYHLYALSGFLICLIVCLFVSLMARLCMRQYRPVEPLLLHPLVRSKDSLTAMAELARHHHPHPYVLSQFQPYYGGHRNQYPVPSSNGDWDDTHYRWPSPSLPPTLKKSSKHFGTLDKGKDLMMLRHSSPEKTSSTNSGSHPGGGRINYGFNKEDYQMDKKRHSTDQFSTSSTNDDSDDMTIDDFGDVVKRTRTKSKSSGSSKRSGSKQRTIVRQSTDEEDDEDGWTTEF